ncbi:RING-type domain-containing protein [Citrus sinensis]|nr:RING-type domain-containing protein [Citrus sinensis]
MNERIESCKKVMGNTLQTPKENLEKEEEKEEESSGSSFTCEICIEPMAASKKFKNKNLCTHPFCQDCIAKYIQVKVQDDNTAKIECPGLECRHDLDPFSCEPIIPSSLFSKWCDVLCEDYVLGFERSYCPNTNCMALVVNECERNGTLKKAQCPSCKQWFCFQCKLKWHAGFRCEESGNLRDPNDIMFGQLVETMNWTRCPGCGHCVERKNGCSVVISELTAFLYDYALLVH